jgi:hypothetical protein
VMGAEDHVSPIRYGLIVAINRPRGAHMGCDARVSVMWSRALHVEDVCDCGLLPCDEF